jgi:hypothetical protein
MQRTGSGGPVQVDNFEVLDGEDSAAQRACGSLYTHAGTHIHTASIHPLMHIRLHAYAHLHADPSFRVLHVLPCRPR